MTNYYVCVWRWSSQVWIPGIYVTNGEFKPVIRSTSQNADFCEIDWRP